MSVTHMPAWIQQEWPRNIHILQKGAKVYQYGNNYTDEMGTTLQGAVVSGARWGWSGAFQNTGQIQS